MRQLTCEVFARIQKERTNMSDRLPSLRKNNRVRVMQVPDMERRKLANCEGVVVELLDGTATVMFDDGRTAEIGIESLMKIRHRL